MKRIYIQPETHYSKPLAYILRILFRNKSWPMALTTVKAEADLVFDHTDPSTLPINVPFWDALIGQKVYSHAVHFKQAPHLVFPDSNEPDWLGTAFYMINACQEYTADGAQAQVTDHYGRFPFENSYQKRFGVIEKNLVQTYLDNFAAAHQLSAGMKAKPRPTRVFLSHDIDTIHGSFLQDGKWALKKGRLDIVMKLVMNEVLGNPHWKNIDKIAQLHTAHDLKSTFFWLATQKTGTNGVKNGDYDSKELASLLKFTASNGLHKSCYDAGFQEELKMLPFETKLNRYHFLKFGLPQGWNDLESAQLQLDASLGFAEHYGFRNSYGLPFRPYNFVTRSAYQFVEVPLNVMDGTLQRYMGVPLKQTATRIIDFLDQHPTDSVISILWHNTFFTQYKYAGYLEEYKKVLLHLQERGIQSITPQEIITEFGND